MTNLQVEAPWLTPDDRRRDRHTTRGRPRAETRDRHRRRATTRHGRQRLTRNPRLVSQYGSPHTISGSFNSIFKVLFSFPSLYFFAIGLSIVFSLGRDLPPIFGLYSQTNLLIRRVARMTDGIRRNQGNFTTSVDLNRSIRPFQALSASAAVHMQPPSYNHNSGRNDLPDSVTG